MISAQELRINNLVKRDNKIYPICSIHSDNTLRLLDGKESIGCFFANSIEPISLTEDWLIKLGFEKAKATDEFGGWLSPYFDDEHSIRIVKDEFGFIHPNSLTFITRFNSVHHLQNFIFALTGTELKLNP